MIGLVHAQAARTQQDRGSSRPLGAVVRAIGYVWLQCADKDTQGTILSRLGHEGRSSRGKNGGHSGGTATRA